MRSFTGIGTPDLDGGARRSSFPVTWSHRQPVPQKQQTNGPTGVLTSPPESLLPFGGSLHRIFTPIELCTTWDMCWVCTKQYFNQLIIHVLLHSISYVTKFCLPKNILLSGPNPYQWVVKIDGFKIQLVVMFTKQWSMKIEHSWLWICDLWKRSSQGFRAELDMLYGQCFAVS